MNNAKTITGKINSENAVDSCENIDYLKKYAADSGLRLDDLQTNNLLMLQNEQHFCFGSDGVRLANFVTEKSGKACDLGAGNGIITILLSGKFGLSVTGVEIQKELCCLLQKNIDINNLGNKATAINSSMQDFCVSENAGAFDLVVCNPPYRKIQSGVRQENEFVAIARHELKVTLAQVVNCAAFLTKSGGNFYIINHIERLAETMFLTKTKRLEPKILQILTPDSVKMPHLFMLSCKKDAKEGLKVLRQATI